MPEHFEIITRTMLAFLILFIGAKLLGKQIIAEMNTFDFIAAISVGSIIANLAFNLNIKIHHAVLAFLILVLVILLVSFISLKSRIGRNLLAGNPTVIIEDGKILEANMRKMRYSLDYLNQQLREKGIFNIDEVLYVVVETNGKVSFLQKPQYRSVTKQDLNIPTKQESNLPIELIMDGEIISKNLRENNLSELKLQEELKKRNLQTKEVVYAVLAANGNIYIDTYKDQIASPTDQE
ncbi:MULTISPECIES: DUF421 domain-containing protein [Bacillaceae]|uniref:DUF421 domain-containing protein n=1 Tax=Gottfriedia luciferensis TaxID=178774 RepID=A0ABX2ZW94_9BACI|nr:MULTISPECIES: DUF421 domain-containing protein [Bacillaceae]ODG94058.1 hypothetical protein BED47_02505 [Gottfriedia luciferensis]PGZ92738.1 DUF421 domain-containing protein [Bacillus sp. AFS029533]